MTSQRPAREAFVEAMQYLSGYVKDDPAPLMKVRQAAEAFADAECGTQSGYCCKRKHNRSCHAACCASLLKEIFGE